MSHYLIYGHKISKNGQNWPYLTSPIGLKNLYGKLSIGVRNLSYDAYFSFLIFWQLLAGKVGLSKILFSKDKRTVRKLFLAYVLPISGAKSL